MIKLKSGSYKLLATSLLLSSLAMFGCESQEDVQPNALQATSQQELRKAETTTYYGPTTLALGGTARTWVEMVGGKPSAIGVDLSREALQNLPHMMQGYVLEMPGQARATGIKTIAFDWNPMGHEPEGVYSRPHFDFHFYMMTEGQLKRIEGGIDEGAYTLIEKGVLPSVYTFGPVPFAVPQMGVHWSDIRSPEFSPAGFSRTFIYGSSKDKITFLEPMITLEYLMSLKTGESVKLPVPSLLIHETPGYYPASYTVSRSADGTYTIALTDLEWHNRNR
ncbi:DUF5602 domain-containing protein [Pontibacter locisalis]|uniref:DUF5602 domain-containing protein n=1 Tax=Pontibacter locisalis TaxID=1719035 RepID=A0ABW5IS66_9BACT